MTPRTLFNSATLKNSSTSRPVLTIAPASHGQSASSRGHVCADNSENTVTSRTYRAFYPLVDTAARSLRLVFNNLYPGSNSGTTVDTVGFNDLTVSAAVEQSDGTIVPVTVSASASWTVPRDGSIVITDPVTITNQTTATSTTDGSTTGVWVRTYASVPASASHTGCATTSGSPTITDASIATGDQGRHVTGTGIPTNSRVGAVSAGTSFTLVNAATTANVNATATNTGLTLTLPCDIPLNLGALYTGDGCTGPAAGANLTTVGAGATTNQNSNYAYGPALLLAPPTKPRMVVSVSDSIFDGYSDPVASGYHGPVARACKNLGIGHVKLSRGGETSGVFNQAVNGRQLRALYISGCTDAVIEYGTNDALLTSAASALGLENNLINIINGLLAAGVKRIALATIPPRTASTDAWATTANQTPQSTSSIVGLAAINAWIRAKPTGVTAVIDLADLCMSVRDSGLWVPGGTTEGVHPSSALMTGTITTAVQAALAAMAP